MKTNLHASIYTLLTEQRPSRRDFTHAVMNKPSNTRNTRVTNRTPIKVKLVMARWRWTASWETLGPEK